MAYSILLSLEKIIAEILDHHRFPISPQEEEHIRSINRCVISSQAFLEEFPQKAKKLKERIRDVAAEAEGIIECFLEEEMYTKWKKTAGGIYPLQKVRDEMDSIVAEAADIKNWINSKDDVQFAEPIGTTPSLQAADTAQTDMVGFDKDMMEMKRKLCGPATQLQKVPIFGMGGIGKTTLARNAYEDPSIVEHFQVRAWVLVSQDYSYGRILFSLLDSLKEFNPDWRKETIAERSASLAKISEEGNESSKEKIHEMGVKVYKILLNRRFLIVMDDIWNTKVLDDVKHLFPESKNRSRIMLTTRLINVARYAKSSTLPHELRLMDADQSWNLLWRKVFIYQNLIPRELESIGRKIARSCEGLPLAIVVIAGLLSMISQTVTSWKEVAGRVRSSFARPSGQIEKILSLSYNHLPPRLKLCFLYMGGFPEDQDINVTDVIKLWIAESFVKPVGSKGYEDTAEEYLEDLVDRNLVVVTKRKSNGKIRFCHLHDTVRQMCVKKSHDEEFLMHIKDPKGPKESTNDLRRISTYSYGLGNTCSSTIRSIIHFDHMLDSFGSSKLLRILYLLRARSHEPLLSDQLFKLSHLRYLAFYYSHPIPRSISNLQCLQTLIIKEISDPRLPVEIWNMPQLRHLIISRIRLPDTTTATPALENLQTLRKVENLVCSKGTLDLIRNLTKLWLAYSKGSGKLLFDNLAHLRRLEKLHLELGFGWFNSGKPPILFTPSSLKQLTLTGWGSRGTYLDIGGPFPNLEVLKLKSFDFELREWRTTDEDFPQLKYLRIEESDITQWDIGSSHFPRLKTLHIHSCPGMSELPECTGDLPTLELIELKFCTDSLAHSAKLIHEEAISNGNDFFQVHCIDCKPRSELIYPSLYEKAMRKAWREQFVAYY